MAYGVWRPVKGRIVLSMPYHKGNRTWLKQVLGPRIRPEFDKANKRWEVARGHFGPVVEAMANRLGRIDVWVDFRSAEKCDTRCRSARSRECTCSCLGKNHGNGITHGWKLAGDSTMVRPSGTIRRHMIVERDGNGSSAKA